MKKTLIFTITFVFVVSVHAQLQPQEPSKTDAKFPAEATYANTKLIYKIIDAPGKSYCYDIYADNRLIIHQSSAPALPGNQGFKTKADAEKVAQLIISKIKKACPTESLIPGRDASYRFC